MAFTITMSNSHFPPFQLTPVLPTLPSPGSIPASGCPSSEIQTSPSRSNPSNVLPTTLPSDIVPPTEATISLTRTARRSFSTRSINQNKKVKMAPGNGNRDSLYINTFTSTLDRDALFSKAANVATILRSLGPSKDSREQGVEALCAYVEGKRSKGKKDDEVRKKLALLEGMVPTDLGDVFVKATIRSGLARRTTHSLPPLSQSQNPLPGPQTQTRSRLSIATITSTSILDPTSTTYTDLSPDPLTSISFLYSAPDIGADSNDEMEPALPETPITQFISFTDSSRADRTASAPFDWSLSPSDTISTDSSAASVEDPPTWNVRSHGGSSARSSTYPSAATIDTGSSFSAPEPDPYFTQTLVEYSSSISATSTDPDSDVMIPPAALGRAPTLLSPLAIGGWGRQWERPLLKREPTLMPTTPATSASSLATCGDSTTKAMDAIDGISLASFPAPPDRSPEALTPPETKTPWAWGNNSPESNQDLQSPWSQIQTPPGPHMDTTGPPGSSAPIRVWGNASRSEEADVGIGGVRVVGEESSSPAGKTIDSSWLSIADSDEVPLAMLAQAKGNPKEAVLSRPKDDVSIHTIPNSGSRLNELEPVLVPIPITSEDDVPLSVLMQQREQEDNVPLAMLINGMNPRTPPRHDLWNGEMRWSRSDGQDWEWEYAGASDDERTITGVESSRWSAVWSDMSLNEASSQVEPTHDGPTEASRIRDAYLSMIQPRFKTSSALLSFDHRPHEQKQEQEQEHGPLLGPEQGDSHVILMAYAQPAPAPTSA
ncbi:hypothetical protein IAT40_004518 [Kwoniella sp. CBS 6097]